MGRMEKRDRREVRGVFLTPGAGRGMARWITVGILLAWDGLLLYMIVECLIEPVYGAVFVAVVSCYLGCHLV